MKPFYCNLCFTGGLPNLVVLNLNHNQIKRLPPEIKRLINGIQELHTFNLNTIPMTNDMICLCPTSLTKLQHLSMQDNKLEEVPVELGLLGMLSEINLTFNCVTQLPWQLCQCKELTRLWLARNQLTSLPDVGIASLMSFSEDRMDGALLTARRL